MSTQNQMAVREDNIGFLKMLIESKKLPAHVRTVEDAFTIQQMGKELGFPTMQAFHFIIPIQGKLSLTAKAIGALLRKGGIKFTTMEDGLWVYADGTASDMSARPTGRTNAEGQPLIEKPVDRRTTIHFLRDGVQEKCSFTWIDARNQGLDTKDNWKRMPKEMLWARCLSKGANRVGADYLLGLYCTDELYDVFADKNTKAKRDEDGQIVEIITEDVEVEIIN